MLTSPHARARAPCRRTARALTIEHEATWRLQRAREAREGRTQQHGRSAERVHTPGGGNTRLLFGSLALRLGLEVIAPPSPGRQIARPESNRRPRLGSGSPPL